MKILQCFRTPVGGLFRHVRDLAREQAAAGHDVGIICDSESGGDQAENALNTLTNDCKLGIHRIPMTRQIGIKDYFAIREIARFADEWRVDILHGHGAKGGAYTRLAVGNGQTSPLKFYTPHGGSLHYSRFSPQGAIFLNLERILLSRTDGLIFESKYAETTYGEKVGGTPCSQRVIHNGLAADEFSAVEKSDTQSDLVFVGELRELKGVATLLTALSKLRDRGLTPTLLIVGSGPDEEVFKDLSKTLNLESQVEFAGAMPARTAFALARTLVVPSHKESLPYIVLEAAAANKPMITTAVGGIPEIYGPFADRLVPPQNVDALANAIWNNLEQYEAAIACASDLRCRVMEDFVIEKMARDILEFYTDAMATKQPRQNSGKSAFQTQKKSTSVFTG